MKLGHRTKTISVTSGKGGVGKTTLVANLAASLGSRGFRVLILDGDLGMANVDIMFGVRTIYSLQDVFNGNRDLNEVIVQAADNVYLIPGGSGIYGLSRLDLLQKQVLLDQVSGLDEHFDFMFIDTAPGIDDNVLYLNTAAQEILVVVNPDPASITDAYALIKVLSQRHHETRFSIIANCVRDEAEANAVYRRLSDVAAKFLCVSLDLKGFIPNDPNLRQATKQQQLVVNVSPGCPSSLGIRRLGEKISGYGQVPELKGSIQFFWQQLSGVA
jgi:flagellar biosynthesis protein FlhG